MVMVVDYAGVLSDGLEYIFGAVVLQREGEGGSEG